MYVSNSFLPDRPTADLFIAVVAHRFPLITVSPSSQLASYDDIEEPLLQRFMRSYYAPTLMRKPVKYFVVALFGGLFVLSWIGARHIELGLGEPFSNSIC